MKLVMPSYCKNFKCTASECKDNCCIGWEIDIDEETKAFYDSVTGSFKDKLSNGIADGETPCFKLKNERCAFLNGNNLCEIYINLGSEHLCQICRDHPRYYEWFEDRIEGGIGLCCEEAARLILSFDKPFSLFESEKEDEPFFDYDEFCHDDLVFARNKIFETLENDELSLIEKLYTAFAFGTYVYGVNNGDDPAFVPYESYYPKGKKENFDIRNLLCSLKNFEEIDPSWGEVVSCLCNSADEIKALLPELIKDEKVERAIKNISIYFFWRYFLKYLFESDYINTPYLCVFSVVVILCLFALEKLKNKSADFESLINCAKYYSKQMEYSEENLGLIKSLSLEEKLSAESLLSLLI